MSYSFDKDKLNKYQVQKKNVKPPVYSAKNKGRNFNRKKGKSLVKGAENRLQNFRQASILAVAFTAFILLFFSFNGDDIMAKNTDENLKKDSIIRQDQVPAENNEEQATAEAFDALENLWANFLYNYPKILIALACLFIAWLVARLVKWILRKSLKKVTGATGIITVVVICIWLLAIGVAFSVIAGDIRALVGSFGLIGLALSWALQTPIESFTAWLLNTFRGYYKVGDRIRVGDVFGDVYKIDFLSTTVWEIGSPYQPGFVNAEQPTGRMVTFPNNEILTGTIINLTGDFPYVWDELTIVIANESDIKKALQVLEEKAGNIIGEYMVNPAHEYSRILKKAGLEEKIPEKPQLYISASDSWTEITIRYLVEVKERRKWKTELLLQITDELNQDKYQQSILPVYPRQQVQLIDGQGKAMSKQVFS